MTQTFQTGSLEYGSASNAYILELILTQTATSQADNTSQLAYKLQLRSGGSNRFQWTVTSSVTLGSTQLPPVTDNQYLDYYSSWVLQQGTVTVSHNDDGTLTLPITASITLPSGNRYAPPDMILTGEMTLASIPRASAVSATDAIIGDKSAILIDRKSPDFTHTVRFSFGSLSGYLADPVGTLSQTPVALTATVLHLPLGEDFYGQIPKSTWGTCYLTVRTLLGDTQIGSDATASFRVTADPERCGPLVSGTVEDVNPQTLALTGDPKCLVRYGSTARCTVTAQARCGATLSSVSVDGSPVTGEFLDIPQAPGTALRFRAVDSRGFAGEFTPTDIRWVPYVPLSCHGGARRNDPTGDVAQITVTGSCFQGSFGLQDNALSVLCSADGGAPVALSVVQWEADTYTATGSLSGLDYRTAHTISLVASDGLSVCTQSLTLGKGIPVFDWGESDFVFHVPVTAPSFNGLDFRSRGLCTDPDTAWMPGIYTTAGGLLLVLPGLQIAISQDGSQRQLRCGTDQPWADF